MLPDNPDAQARLFYLLLLLLGLGSFFLWGQGQRLGRSVRDLAVWGLIFAMVVIAYGFRDTLRQQLFPAATVELGDGAIELRRQDDGHFHATLEVNGQPVRFLVDTGASGIVLSRADAAAAGLDVAGLAYTGRAETANGPVATAPVRLAEVRFGRPHRHQRPRQRQRRRARHLAARHGLSRPLRPHRDRRRRDAAPPIAPHAKVRLRINQNAIILRRGINF